MGTDVTEVLLRYGILGVILVLVLLGWIWPRPSVDRLIQDKERAESQRDALLKVYQEEIMPTLLRSVSAMEAQARQSEKLSNLMVQVRTLLSAREP